MMDNYNVSEEDILALAELLSREFERDCRRYNRDYAVEEEQ